MRWLVYLTAEPNAQVAEAARRKIDDSLRDRSARAIAARGRKLPEADQRYLEALADALVETAPTMRWTARRWLESVVYQLVDQVEDYAPQTVIRILDRCEEALAMVEVAHRNGKMDAALLRRDAAHRVSLLDAAVGAGTPLAAPAPRTRRRQASPEESLRDQNRVLDDSDLLARQFLGRDSEIGGSAALRAVDQRRWQRTDSADDLATRTPAEGTALLGDDDVPRATNELRRASQAPVVLSERLTDDSALAAPLDDGRETNLLSVIDVPGPDEMRRLLRELRDMSPDQLRIVRETSGPYQAKAAVRVLAEQDEAGAERRRTRGRPSQASSPRVASAETLAPVPEGASWRDLRRMVESDDPALRLQALSALATTRDPQLAEIARRRAIYDPDPEVADAAQRILETVRR